MEEKRDKDKKLEDKMEEERRIKIKITEWERKDKKH